MFEAVPKINKVSRQSVPIFYHQKTVIEREVVEETNSKPKTAHQVCGRKGTQDPLKMEKKRKHSRSG